jgi:hypothetical protein
MNSMREARATVIREVREHRSITTVTRLTLEASGVNVDRLEESVLDQLYRECRAGLRPAMAVPCK